MNGTGIPVGGTVFQEELPGMMKYPPVLFFKTIKLPCTAPVVGNVSVPGLTEVML